MDLTSVLIAIVVLWILSLFFRKKSVAKENFIKEQLAKSVMVKLEHIAAQNLYLVHRADNNEFILQSNSLDSIMPMLREKFTDNNIFFATEDYSLLALFANKDPA